MALFVSLLTAPLRLLRAVVGSTRQDAAQPPALPAVALPPEDPSMHRPGEGRLPVPRYDELTATDAMIAVRTLDDLAQVQTLARHERNNKDRTTVVKAIQDRVAELSAAGRT